MGGSGLSGPGEGGQGEGLERVSGLLSAAPGPEDGSLPSQDTSSCLPTGTVHPAPVLAGCPPQDAPIPQGLLIPCVLPRGSCHADRGPGSSWTRNLMRTFADATLRSQLHWSGQSSQPWSDSGLSFCLSATLETSKAGPDHPTHSPSPLHSSWPGHRASLLKVGVGSLLSSRWRTRVRPPGCPAGLLVVCLLHLVTGFLRGHTES